MHKMWEKDNFEMEELKEYIDNGDGYVKPERRIENEVLDIRLYCDHNYPECKVYIKGTEGYNGGFVAETGQFCDLRNQGFICKEHQK